MWGLNIYGQLGNESILDALSPVNVVGSHYFTILSAGDLFTNALKADGSVWSWGSNGFGQFGNNSLTGRSSPVSAVCAVCTQTVNICKHKHTVINMYSIRMYIRTYTS
jgi:alpha-tubulin suppressor-like RCC1 family protein